MSLLHFVLFLTFLFDAQQVSDGGVHSHINHLFQFLEAAKAANVPKAFVQFFADGRDTSPTSGGKKQKCCVIYIVY